MYFKITKKNQRYNKQKKTPKNKFRVIVLRLVTQCIRSIIFVVFPTKYREEFEHRLLLFNDQLFFIVIKRTV